MISALKLHKNEFPETAHIFRPLGPTWTNMQLQTAINAKKSQSFKKSSGLSLEVYRRAEATHALRMYGEAPKC